MRHCAHCNHGWIAHGKFLLPFVHSFLMSYLLWWWWWWPSSSFQWFKLQSIFHTNKQKILIKNKIMFRDVYHTHTHTGWISKYIRAFFPIFVDLYFVMQSSSSSGAIIIIISVSNCIHIDHFNSAACLYMAMNSEMWSKKIYLYNTWLFNKSNKNWMCLSNTKKNKQTKQNIVSNSYVCK